MYRPDTDPGSPSVKPHTVLSFTSACFPVGYHSPPIILCAGVHAEEVRALQPGGQVYNRDRVRQQDRPRLPRHEGRAAGAHVLPDQETSCRG